MIPVHMQSPLPVEQCVVRICRARVLLPVLGSPPKCTTAGNGRDTTLTAKWLNGARLAAKLTPAPGGTALSLELRLGWSEWLVVFGMAVVNPVVFAVVGCLMGEPLVEDISNPVLFGLLGCALAAVGLPIFGLALRVSRRRIFRGIAEACEAELAPPSL